MNTPLIDIRRHRATQAAKSMLNYPLKYFANTNNIKRLESIVEGDERALKSYQHTKKSNKHNFLVT
ncbi:hypothetical protein QW180_02675 [Vibrio sinaloensis]|nr:hypothetical protein [Vibrio sinaloensis]